DFAIKNLILVVIVISLHLLRPLAIIQPHQRRPEQPALESVTCGNRFRHSRVWSRLDLVIGQLVTLPVERLRRGRGEWRQADSAGSLAAGILKIADLLDQGRLTRAHRALVQGINMIQLQDKELLPVGFGSPRCYSL